MYLEDHASDDVAVIACKTVMSRPTVPANSFFGGDPDMFGGVTQAEKDHAAEKLGTLAKSSDKDVANAAVAAFAKGARNGSISALASSTSAPHATALRQNIAAARPARTGCSSTRSSRRSHPGGSRSRRCPEPQVQWRYETGWRTHTCRRAERWPFDTVWLTSWVRIRAGG